MRTPRITIVCIFLNEERFLAEAIDSVLAQDCDDWELVLVDDGSTDGSTAIARGFAKGDSRISYIDHAGHSNRGMSVSRNVGVAAGTGELVTFIDGDDCWPLDKLSRQIAIMDHYPEIALAAGAMKYWESWRGGEDHVEHCGKHQDCVTQTPDALLEVYPLGPNGGASPNLMIRRTAYQEVGGFEESFTGFYEDQAFFAKVYAHAPVLFSSEVWQYYRQHPDSCCARTEAAGLYLQERQNLLGWLEKYISGLDAEWQPRAMALVRREKRLLRIRVWASELKAAVRSVIGRG